MRAASDGQNALAFHSFRPFDWKSPWPYAATLGSTRMLRALAAFGKLSSRTPFFNMAVTFPVSTSAGRSTTRMIWFEHDSE